MLLSGADILDIGACSTRPGSKAVGADLEWARLSAALPIIREVAPNTPISIDTYHASVVEKVYSMIGNFIVNDISSGRMDGRMLRVVGDRKLPYVAMHMRGTPENMQTLTEYKDGIIAEVKNYFMDFAVKADQAGIKEWYLDPGFGFAKTISQNYTLMQHLAPLLQKTLDDCLQAEPWDRPVAKELEEIALQALKGETSAEVAVNATFRNSLGRSLGGSVGTPMGGSMGNAMNGSMGNSLGNSANPGASAPQQAPAKSKTPLFIGIGVLCALLIVGLVYFLTGKNANEPKDVITIEQSDSIKAIEDYYAALSQLKSTNTDSVAIGFDKMKGLAAEGNKDAIFQVAYTYAWIPKDLESNRRKKALNWTIDESTGRLASDDLNKEAVRWLNKSIEVTEGKDYKSLYWLSFYYYYGWGVTENLGEVKQLLQQSLDNAKACGDIEFMSKVQDTINNLNE